MSEHDPVMVRHALEYAARGWRVLPCRGKIPLTKRGVHEASSDPDIIRAWWAQAADANIGIATGRGLCVLDVDPRHGGDASLRELEHEHGEILTLTARTGGGGMHLYLAGELPQRVGFRPGLDLKAAGGYVIAPPSLHDSGRRYEWIAPDDLPQTPQSVPAWLAEIIQPSKTEPAKVIPFPTQRTIRTDNYIVRAIEDECLAVAHAPEGMRNDRLNRAAFALARFVASGQAHEGPVRQALELAATHAGLTQREIRRTLDSAFRARSA